MTGKNRVFIRRKYIKAWFMPIKTVQGGSIALNTASMVSLV
jgi:hypothetical protein